MPTFSPDWASPPGHTIAELLDDQEISVADLATRLGESTEMVVGLMEGRTPITLRIARLLREALGAPVEFWMTRDHHYRVDSHRREREWLRELPLADMIKFGWLRPPPTPADELQACLRFFDVPSVEAWRDRILEAPALAAFRTSPSFDSHPAAVAAWLSQGTREGSALDCAPWAPSGFQASLESTRTLTREKDPSRFMPDLQARCAAFGVATVVVRAPAGCSASGAAAFISPRKALIILSARHRSDDHLWFTFFHEAGHLLLHGDKALHVDGDVTPLTSEEEEANRFAAEVLVPTQFRDDMNRLPLRMKDVIRFARKVGVSPGVIVGQLQHSGRLGFDRLNSMKRRFEWHG